MKKLIQPESHRIPSTATKTVLRFTRIDNIATAMLNNWTIYSSGLINEDPPLNIEVVLTGLLMPGNNFLRIQLVNWPREGDNPWHIAYRIESTVDGKTETVVDIDVHSAGSAPAGLSYDLPMILIRE